MMPSIFKCDAAMSPKHDNYEISCQSYFHALTYSKLCLSFYYPIFTQDFKNRDYLKQTVVYFIFRAMFYASSIICYETDAICYLDWKFHCINASVNKKLSQDTDI